jgi:hypothetical protein
MTILVISIWAIMEKRDRKEQWAVRMKAVKSGSLVPGAAFARLSIKSRKGRAANRENGNADSEAPWGE